MSQEKLAQEASVSRVSVQGIESGKTGNPHASTLFAIARALGFEHWEDLSASVKDPPVSLRDNPLVNDAIRRQIEFLSEEFNVSKQQVVNCAVSFLANQPNHVRDAVLREISEIEDVID